MVCNNTAVIHKMNLYPKIYNITPTLMFIYIYQNFILALSVNERSVYNAILLSEKVKPIQLLEKNPGAAFLKSISLKNHWQHLQASTSLTFLAIYSSLLKKKNMSVTCLGNAFQPT